MGVPLEKNEKKALIWVQTDLEAFLEQQVSNRLSSIGLVVGKVKQETRRVMKRDQRAMKKRPIRCGKSARAIPDASIIE